jgi:glycine oxidase
MATADTKTIAIRGAGITGLWQALALARAGHKVTLYERSETLFADAASANAGAMLAPHCEGESADALIGRMGLRGLALWKETYPGTLANGSLVVTHPRDRSLLDRFARMTGGHRWLDAEAVAELEPSFQERFTTGLYFPEEAHLPTLDAMRFILDQALAAGATLRLGATEVTEPADLVVDCRGMGARDVLPELRGVRGERLVVRSKDVSLSRMIRVLHPRFPLYVVPWGEGVHMLGATAIESEEAGGISLRSAMELLSAAYALDPAFGEAEILQQGAAVRPAFPDNRPRIIVSSRYIYVNGLYRHGFLLAPVLAELVAAYLETGETQPEVFFADLAERRTP